MLTVLFAAAVFLPQEPTSKPTSRPTPPTDRERLVEAQWPEDAPGKQVMVRGGKQLKFLPMRGAPYATASEVKERHGVRDQDLVIGLRVGDTALAYPINMLGGPQREIVNDEFAGVPFCVNW